MKHCPITPEEQTPGRRHRSAIHEAGHTLITYLVGQRFEYVTIAPRDNLHPDEDAGGLGTLGHVRRHVRAGDLYRLRTWQHGDPFTPIISTADPRGAPLDALWPDYREDAEEEMIINLAGYAAEWIHLDCADEEADEYSIIDVQDNDSTEGSESQQIAQAFTMDEDEAYAYYNLMRHRARNLLNLPACRVAVERLAAELAAREKIGEAEAITIMRACFEE
jgi:hypothetical protein